MNKKAQAPGRARPGRDILQARRHILAAHDRDRLGGAGPRDIKRVLVVDAASRSGSSFLHSLLSRHPDVVSLNGEDIVFQKLHGLCEVAGPADSDSLPPGRLPDRKTLDEIALDIMADSGSLYAGEGPFPEKNFLADCAQRFLLQWPGACADPDAVHACAAAALAKGPRPGPGFDPAGFWTSFLSLLAGKGLEADASCYDMPSGARGKPPAPPEREGPPGGGAFLEEPPFVIPAPRTFPAAGELGSKVLLLKSSSNCYRTRLLKALFPAADLRFLLLARNPLASVNGLMDGWLSPGFFSRDLGRTAKLDIKGYTSPDRPWSSRWWKFDLPPGWLDHTRRPLEEVCALQWLSANDRILKDAAAGALGEPLRVKYEDLLAPAALARELDRILAFAGLRPFGLAGGAARAVMAVAAPGPGKWRGRSGALLPLCAGRVKQTAEKLGYDPKEARTWE